MALLCSRLIGRQLKSRLAMTTRSKGEFLKPEELATGREKWQLEQIAAGNDDPFKMRAIQRTANSKTNPIQVPSVYDCRIIGCVCEEDSANIVWMWLFKGEPRRCHCGHWFKLTEYKPF